MTEANSLPVVDGPDGELVSPRGGPKGTTSLRSRRSPLAEPEAQLRLLGSITLENLDHRGDFDAAVRASAGHSVHSGPLEIFQINLGKLCNMTCRHCHVDAGPDRWDQVMDRDTVDACLRAVDRSGAHTVDLTGGAPELNPHFRYLVEECASRGVHVVDRCNLTVLLLPRSGDLPEFLAAHGVEVVCSLPHSRRRNTDAQRGDGTYEKSIEALRHLNGAGYGGGDPARRLTLVTNPAGAVLTGSQRAMEREWKAALAREHGITFDRLIALNNLPIARFLEWLESTGNLESYMRLLVNSFNPATIDGLMCRNTVSVSWDGRIYDCDFNQMLDLETRSEDGGPMHVAEFDPVRLAARRIVVGRHCYGCTAGAGSSCGGALDD
jgi:radical SAM/Cys-rich protein